MRPVPVHYIDHHDDGSVTVRYTDYRVERITAKDEITAICKRFAREKEDRLTRPYGFPNLTA
jgi:hypothetical protein